MMKTETETVVADAATNEVLPGSASVELMEKAFWWDVNGECRGYASGFFHQGVWELARFGPRRAVYVAVRPVAR